jgi:hypothetical protein
MTFQNLFDMISPFSHLVIFGTAYGQIWPFYFWGTGNPGQPYQQRSEELQVSVNEQFLFHGILVF